MEKFSVGMDIRKVVTAKNMNEFVGAVNWIKENSGPASKWNGTFSGFKGGEIRVKFDGEESLDMFSAVALTDLELTPENCDTFEFETPTFNAEPFAEDSDLPFAILLEPANPGEIAKAVMIGITPAKVTILDDSHEYAKPTADGDGMLESCESGTARILWKAGESDEQWCVLQLGGGGESGGYRGMWAVSLNDSWQFTVPASESGNIILTEDRLFENVTQELVSQGSAASSGWTWCYLHISLQRGIELITAQTPYSVSYDYADYTDDYVPLAKYSAETGVIQLQYGAVRINRYWLVTGGGSGGGGGEAL